MTQTTYPVVITSSLSNALEKATVLLDNVAILIRDIGDVWGVDISDIEISVENARNNIERIWKLRQERKPNHTISAMFELLGE